MKLNRSFLLKLIVSASIGMLAACSSSDDDSDGGITDNESTTVVLFDEEANGDISGDASSPQAFQLGDGVSSISGTVVAGDVDYLTINVPAGSELTAIELSEYVSEDDVSFIGIQAGTVFTELPETVVVENLLGQTLFGTDSVGTDILDDLSTGEGAQGFIPPLPAGDYTFWIQETGQELSAYTFDFVVAAAAETETASVVQFDEEVEGDIIGDPNNPQPFQFADGVNSISASVVAGDVDYVTINVPAGSQLSAIDLVEYVSADDVAFIGIQAGSVFTELPEDPATENLLGYALFGTATLNEVNVDDVIGVDADGNDILATADDVRDSQRDLLTVMGVGEGAQGFIPPLEAGDYTFWIQQTGQDIADYSLDFVVEATN